MRTLHFGLRVADLERSLAFYIAVGYVVVGSVPETVFGHLTMLKLPDDDFLTVELVHDPAKGEVDLGAGLSRFVIQVASLDATITELAAQADQCNLDSTWPGPTNLSSEVVPDDHRLCPHPEWGR